jgi:hypothetical protein
MWLDNQTISHEFEVWAKNAHLTTKSTLPFAEKKYPKN